MYTQIGSRIRSLRRKRGLTQEQLAQAAEISLSFLGHIERGTRILSVDTLRRISLALHCSADELLGIDALADSCAVCDELDSIIADLQALKRRFK